MHPQNRNLGNNNDPYYFIPRLSFKKDPFVLRFYMLPFYGPRAKNKQTRKRACA
jgi:hypothetical protein